MAQTPRPAATLILLRPGAQGPEVLMIQRTHSAAFLGGAYVFPGGAIDAADSDSRILERVIGLNDSQASARLGIGSGGLGYYVAAIRECFEESGVLFLFDQHSKPISAERAASLEHYRRKPFVELLEAEDLLIPAGALAGYGPRITAPGRAPRFDARLFSALAPEGQE